jgi:F0F1-type ATP synthase assembly protein I
VLANHFLFENLTEIPFVMKVIWLSLTIGMAAGVYFVMTKVLKVTEAEDALAMLSRKLRK